MTNKIKAIVVAAFVGVVAYKAKSAGVETGWINQVSVSPFVAFSHDLSGGEDYGAGLSLGYEFNKYVKGRVQAIGYSNDDWGGTAIDEGAVLIEATVIRYKGARLYSVGGLNRHFQREDWGLSGGAGIGLRLSKNVELFGESQVQFYDKAKVGLLNSAGLTFRF